MKNLAREYQKGAEWKPKTEKIKRKWTSRNRYENKGKEDEQ